MLGVPPRSSIRFYSRNQLGVALSAATPSISTTIALRGFRYYRSRGQCFFGVLYTERVYCLNHGLNGLLRFHRFLNALNPCNPLIRFIGYSDNDALNG